LALPQSRCVGTGLCLGKGILKISNRLPTEGDRVFVVGNPRGLEWSVSDGIVASIRENEDSGKLIQITAPISPGSSGSPVIDSQGRVIGVATLTLSNGQNLNFAIPSYQLSALRRGELKALATYNDEMKKVRRERSEQMRLRGAQIEQKAIGIEGSKAGLPYFEEAVEIDPEYGNAWWYLADALEILARYPEAMDAYKRAMYIADEAYRSSKSVDDLSDLFMGHLGLAEIYLKTENPLGATDEHKILRTLLDLLPSATASPKRPNKKLEYDHLLYFANGLKADIEKYYKSR
jgi:tetratricopeptide (TPR) repeat protein